MLGFKISWSLFVSDFEATALSTDGHPIEVGIAIVSSALLGNPPQYAMHDAIRGIRPMMTPFSVDL